MEDNVRDILDGIHIPLEFDVGSHAEETCCWKICLGRKKKKYGNMYKLSMEKGDKATLDDFVSAIPIVKRNVCYICCAVLFDDQDRVLLVQEAKQSCFGQWYLPAGRLERGETIVEGTIREVKEESGLECKLTSLLCAEVNGIWIRFTFVGSITGGKLKTLEDKDSESLQAQFFQQDQLPGDIRSTKLRSKDAEGSTCVLRCKDILKLIHLAREYWVEKSYKCLPVIHPHKYVFHRFIILNTTCDGPSMFCLVVTKGDKPHLPSLLISIKRTFAIEALLESILGKALKRPSDCSFKLCGLAGVEHRGTGASEEDGLCLTYQVTVNVVGGKGPPEVMSSDYTWQPVTSPDLRHRLQAGSNEDMVPML